MLTFDSTGRPQPAFVYACRPEGVLAIVGAELLSPDALVGVAECEAIHCDRFFAFPLVGKHVRAGGDPPEYCEQCRKNSTARVQKRRFFESYPEW